jgi:hypothetical protein
LQSDKFIALEFSPLFLLLFFSSSFFVGWKYLFLLVDSAVWLRFAMVTVTFRHGDGYVSPW